jgi:hypothetical protein
MTNPEWLEKLTQVQNCISLLSSMAYSGEAHSKTSEAERLLAQQNLKYFRALLSKYRLCEREAARWMNPDTGETYASPENGDQPLYPEAKAEQLRALIPEQEG